MHQASGGVPRLLFVDTHGGRWASVAVEECARAFGNGVAPEAAAFRPEAAGALEIETAPAGGDIVILLETDESKEGAEGIALERVLSSTALVGAPVLLRWKVPAGEAEIRRELADRISALARAEVLPTLVEQRRMLDRVLDTMQDGVIIHDTNRNILVFNSAAERITGLSREQVLGRSCHGVFSPDGICGSHCPFCSPESAEAYDGARYEFNFADAKGEQKRLSMFSTPVELYSGGPRGVLAVIRDVTEVSALRKRFKRKDSFHGMVAISDAMHEVFDTIRSLAVSEYPVLITGESGTGKELVARAIHNESRRGAGPFVPVNCGALPENILESELFGHVRGAFTGAIRDKKGRFELADGGTLFLDEVGELSPAFQVKLLRVLEQKRFEPVGAEHTKTVDVRIISATNRDLKKMVSDGSFRADLFYRLAVVPIELPPLRKRREDLPALVEQILAEIREETGKQIEGLSDDAMDALYRYGWPGNIRELINV
ncbi:MAG: PAS domain S-box protein, partial [Deltaproteobacteria bacterium]